MEDPMEQECGVARPNIDLTLAEAEVNDDLANISYVTRVLAADSANLNDVQKVRVMLHNSATKAVEERVVSRSTFVKLIESTKAWRAFTGKASKKAPPTVGPLLVPSSEAPPHGVEAPRRLRRAEHILSQRTGRILLVLERCIDNLNQHAILRTAECLGVQNVWLVNPPDQRKKNEGLNRNVTMVWEIWATDLCAEAVCLDESAGGLELPQRVAIIAGREGDGVSEEMLKEADRRVYLPMYGFTDSFNLSVAMALLVQRLFYMCPEARRNLTPEEKHQLRIQWYTKLAKGVEKNREEYARYINHPPPPLDDLRDPTKRPGANKGIMKSRKRINQRTTATAASAATASNLDRAAHGAEQTRQD
ncbi:RNA methyltransferase, TrmH superfamily protein [Acanthamoeba castellanii str. Neff]|uniref:RNA methyltransferase, TrmH superfamily protein n=1 Tax=Acanthamoeba castellanii (strain ATCC 30010 / Neff) TaxID=1257118 RepID=L8HDK4_ACACF|nr:RNA methyltransferase, TrmH superfamily protein [Acanthamoeba castellanii str. Neff]ELR23275.1 RNA methyltransferase, TrmH superfamily protein [Acanthamoeba castellanii str. Neff]